MPVANEAGLVYYRDPRLRRICRQAAPGEPGLAELAGAMMTLMKRHDGVGLAAPQVGDDRRVIVVDAPGYRKGRGRLVLLNPVVETVSGQQGFFQEGCLSFPGIYREIRRPLSARVLYQDLDGERRVLEDDGLLARIVQHEIDHLDAVLFIDHLSGWRRREVDLRMRLRFPGHRRGKGDRR